MAAKVDLHCKFCSAKKKHLCDGKHWELYKKCPDKVVFAHRVMFAKMILERRQPDG